MKKTIEDLLNNLISAGKVVKASGSYFCPNKCSGPSDAQPPLCNCFRIFFNNGPFRYQYIVPDQPNVFEGPGFGHGWGVPYWPVKNEANSSTASEAPWFYHNIDPNHVPQPGYHRYEEWPSYCPSLSEFLSPAFSSVDEWKVYRNGLIDRLAGQFGYGSLRSSEILCRHPGYHNQLIWRDPDCGSRLGAILNRCAFEKEHGRPCDGEALDDLWAQSGYDNAVPPTMMIARRMDEFGCFGDTQQGACCEPQDFAGFTCRLVIGAASCNGQFHSGKTCEQIGGNNCGFAPNLTTTQLGRESAVMSQLLKKLRVNKNKNR